MRRVRTLLGLATIAMLALPPAAAQRGGHAEATYAEGGGSGGWRGRENRHGAIVWRGAIRLYLGRDCDAWSQRYGRGRWGWANGGWLVVFPGRRFGFPRQDPPISNARCDVPS